MKIYYALNFFFIGDVKLLVFIAVVEEGESTWPEGCREDEADVVLTSEIIDLNELVDVVKQLCVAHNAVGFKVLNW